MTLIKSISGIRGTIGGKVGEGLTPIDTVKFTSAYGKLIRTRTSNNKIVVGRDARISGKIINRLVCNTLVAMGFDVIDLGLSTTPTVEVAVPIESAAGGIILTASHNPKQWNALKLLNEKGEFISASEGEELLKIADNEDFEFSEIDKLGSYVKNDTYIDRHIEEILKLPLVDVESIQKRKFKIVIDCVNSTGGIAVPKLLKSLGVFEVKELYCEPNGHFPHNPEPLPEHLTEISKVLKEGTYDLGITVDPDVDRLAFLNEDGTVFGEEYTLVAVADYILKNKKGNSVSNMSSTRALKDVTVKNGGDYAASAVGEVNVVEKMKEINAVIGGEGNGGIIYPELHYGRDALVGIALFLTYLSKTNKSCSELRASFPEYIISKNKIELTPDINVDDILTKMTEKYKREEVDLADGVKINFSDSWVHLRKSNTEPIIRIYSEANTKETADNLSQKIINEIKEII